IESPHDAVIMSSACVVEGDFLVRLYNPGESDAVAMVNFKHSYSAAEVRQLDESPVETLSPQDDGRCQLLMPAHAVRTVAFAPVHAPAHGRDQASTPPKPTTPPQKTGVTIPRAAVPRSAQARAFLGSVSLPPVVDEGFVAAEGARCEELRKQYEDVRTQAAATQPNAYKAMLARSALSTAHRTLLEAEISVIMAERKLKQTKSGRALPEPYDENTREALRQIGRKLNDARIQKRTDDYLLAVTEGATTHATE
ncbi:MAG: hypothetical protein EA428_12660, partial [Spirochaetaceae bacterium]